MNRGNLWRGRVWEGVSSPTPGSFCIFRVKKKRFGAYFGWICEVLSIQNLRRKYSFHNLLHSSGCFEHITRRKRNQENMWRGWEGIPLPLQGVFAFLGFKISNLVHTFGVFDDMQPVRKELDGVWEGVSPQYQGVFAFLEFKISNLVH